VAARLRTLFNFLVVACVGVTVVLSFPVGTGASLRAGVGDYRVFAPELAADPGSSTPPGTSQSQTVTLSDDGGVIEMRRGDEFLLKLGEDYHWSVEVADPSIVSRVPNITVVRGAQGVYQAYQSGTTALTATGTAICPEGVACPLYARLFRITVVVH
jgi:hypothetical protein